MTPWIDVAGDPVTGLLLIADHASDRVPEGIDLGVDAAAMREHVAIDIGVAPLARALCAALRCPGILGNVSRLVIDLNREEDRDGLIPLVSDGWTIMGNASLTGKDRDRRIAEYWRPYHDQIADCVAEHDPKILISLHSFTPHLRMSGEQRPWDVGVLYNRDERAPTVALPLLAEAGLCVGDNLPYSGKLLNATMNRHGEANGIAYLGLEVRQDLIGNAAGVTRWSGLLAPVIRRVAECL